MRCLACDSKNIAPALDLGQQPLANHLLKHADEPFTIHPLGLVYCQECGHGQLSHFVPPEDLFVDYLYASGTSGSLGRYFDWFCDRAAAEFAASDSDVLEVACNDGSLLARLADRGFRTLGVDPAANLAEEGRKNGLEIVTAFWPCPKLIGDRKFDLIIGMNVLAHTPTPFAFLQGVEQALKDDGLCVIQTSQAKMLINGEFDTIYHEHFSFFTPHSMEVLAKRAGLEVRAVDLVDVHGTSFAFVLAKPGCTRDAARLLASGAYMVEHGQPLGPVAGTITGSVQQYKAFADAAHARMARIRDIVLAHRQEGGEVCFVGAAAKAITFMHAAGIRPDHLYDEAPLKIGRTVPGIDRVIKPLTAIIEARNPLVVISAWNFWEELSMKVKRIAGQKNMKFLVHFPEVREYK
ncbi:class I SAM-dependent methyltransferase [Niveispirillum cyanobacteriorum]|uniref:Uncharacterized protein n=1 Tax=Niveispirillum cyanobacteriorum TaxID=1612173 RepID=A0A2K9N8C1_9PROT|nr:class I SAM-dependent methyltransferase [Niveispirillum cyanobacteriorum]AUN29393.1 hypothetical protein C0V82_03430 [Niveispirillum cyanobacteriorum]GGE64497.1 methyltransferase [Niveispirillum cyanobacteriorum]